MKICPDEASPPWAARLETLEVTRSGATIWVRLNRPEKLNAVSRRMLSELVELCRRMEDESGVHFVVLAGNGRAFSSGADLDEMVDDLSHPEAIDLARSGQRLALRALDALESMTQVTFGLIEGPAVGAGFAISSVLDFRVMTENAYLSLPETDRGLHFAYAATPRLVAALGRSRAKEMIMFAERLDARASLAEGLVNRVVPDGAGRDEVERMIGELAVRDWGALRVTKTLANAAVRPHTGDISLAEPELTGLLLQQNGALPTLRAFRGVDS